MPQNIFFVPMVKQYLTILLSPKSRECCVNGGGMNSLLTMYGKGPLCSDLDPVSGSGSGALGPDL